MTRWVGLLALFLVVVASSRVAIAEPGAPLNNSYQVELFQGPVFAPLRVTGLAGAYTAYAEGVDGLSVNPASSAVREPSSVHEIDYNVAFSLSFPATFGSTDFDNDGKSGFTYKDFVFYTVGGMTQVGPFGVGVIGDFQRYNVTPKTGANSAQSSLTLGRIDITAGWGFLDNQLIVGGGARGAWLDISSSRPTLSSQTLLSMIGFAPEVGVLVRPNYVPWRIGATFRAPVNADAMQDAAVVTDEAGVRRAEGFAVPHSVHMPWEVTAGFALQLGPRPLNPTWVAPARQEADARQRLIDARSSRAAARDAELAAIPDRNARDVRARYLAKEDLYLLRQEDERLRDLEPRMLAERRALYWNWPREYVLVIVEAQVIGASDNAVSIESFLSQKEQRSGERVTITPRLGFEGEPVVGVVKTRFGTYVEPSRFAGRSARQHFTFAFDVRVFAFKGWWFFAPATYRISAVADLAPRYENLGVSFGAWY